tara:strand:- start:63 stop:218 length:156 start_codon:yes stop_codon:yes gene_type:complete
MKRIINLFVNYFNIQFDADRIKYLSGKGKPMAYKKRKTYKSPVKKSKPKDK